MFRNRTFVGSQISEWNGIVPAKRLIKNGLTPANAASSAREIIANSGTTTNGVYWINLPTVGPTPLYCIMDPIFDGGGWMMIMKATRGGTFTYSSSYWTAENTLNYLDTTRNDADAKFDSFNYFVGNDLLAVFPDMSNGGSISSSTIGWTWVQNSVISNNTARNLFNGGQVYLGNPFSYSGFGSPWSTQTGMYWYGINYTQNGSNPVRWGFAWNNEADHSSNDVTGGIGVGRPGYSAGDAIYCCQVQTGVNRSARVEMYIR